LDWVEPKHANAAANCRGEDPRAALAPRCKKYGDYRFEESRGLIIKQTVGTDERYSLGCCVEPG
jgi:hypothetical protein